MKVLSVFSSTFGDNKAMDNAMTTNGAVGASVFGFVDGMLTGMATEVRSALQRPSSSSIIHGFMDTYTGTQTLIAI